MQISKLCGHDVSKDCVCNKLTPKCCYLCRSTDLAVINELPDKLVELPDPQDKAADKPQKYIFVRYQLYECRTCKAQFDLLPHLRKDHTCPNCVIAVSYGFITS